MNLSQLESDIREILKHEDILMVNVSSDFQCDQTGGYPTAAWWSREAGKLWLYPATILVPSLWGFDDVEREALQACADFGFRRCESNLEYNAILKELGEDAVQSAWLPEEDEDQQIGGIQL